jgi:nitrogen regulatory protein PII 1
MIRAFIRPNKELAVINSLENAGFYSMTKVDVLGWGRQKGVQAGRMVYDELLKLMLIIVAQDQSVDDIVNIIINSARTGNAGDGKIFVSDVLEAYTIRTGEKKL